MPPCTNVYTRSPQVILSANVSHYYHAAFALQRAGYLKRYICAIGITEKQRCILRLLPSLFQRRLQSRTLTDIDARLVRPIWWPEVLQRSLPKLGPIPREIGDYINNYLFDWAASVSVTQCDIFHFMSSVGLYSAKRAKRLGSIVICDERAEYPDFQRQIVEQECATLRLSYRPQGLSYERKVKAEYALADYFIVPSSYARQTFVDSGIEEGKIFVVPYGVDLDLLHPSNKHAIDANPAMPPMPERFQVAYVGQIVPRKGVHYLVQAFEQLPTPEAELVLIGWLDPSMEGLIKQSMRKDPRIRVIGHVPKVDLASYYRTASVLVLPSLADSYGLVSLEAMASGLPVIVTENCGSKEVIRDGTEGFVVPIRDTKALEDRLLQLYHDPLLRSNMGKAACLKAGQYTWKRYGECLLSTYDEVLRRKGRHLSGRYRDPGSGIP